jgi:hypothetical protein
MGRVPDAPAEAGQPVLETQLVAPAAVATAAPRLAVGDVLSRTMRVWWAHVGPFTAMSVVVYAPMLAAFGLFFGWVLGAPAGRPPDAAELGPRIAAMLAGSAVTLVLSVVQLGAVTYATIGFLRGERATLGRMLGAGFRRGLPVVGTGFAVWLVTMAGFLLLFVPGVLFLVAACVAVPAAVVERPGVVGAIRRSFDLTRGSRGALFAAGLVIMVVLWVLSAVVQVAAMVLASLALSPAEAMPLTLVTSQLGNALFSVVPVVAIAVCYHDLRFAREGVETAELARVFE